MLKFSFGNAKLTRGEVIFDLPAGHSCPFAKDCRSCAHRETGKITDGKDIKFRCYAASLETRPAVRAARWHNFDAVRATKQSDMLFSLIDSNLPLGLVYRVHSSGDFFSQQYFDTWMDVARAHPERTFYAYTKALPFWVKRLGVIPKNFKLVASFGGTHDHLIAEHNLRFAKVVLSSDEAAALGLPIDHDDSHAWQTDESFALLIHNTQPAGTPAAKAWQALRMSGQSGYSRAAVVR